MIKSKLHCPACDQSLTLGNVTAQSVGIWCGNPRCKSITCDHGGDGSTEAEAYEMLVSGFEKERDSKEDE